MKTCHKCQVDRIPDGGVQTGPDRWVCASCWIKRVASSNRKRDLAEKQTKESKS